MSRCPVLSEVESPISLAPFNLGANVGAAKAWVSAIDIAWRRAKQDLEVAERCVKARLLMSARIERADLRRLVQCRDELRGLSYIRERLPTWLVDEGLATP